MGIFSPQCIGGSYQHTDKPQLLELAEHNLRLKSPLMKMRDTDEGFEKVLDMDFKYFMFWWRSRGQNFVNGVTEQSLKEEYDATYSFCCDLIRKYSGSGKSFFLGNWEGDWYLLRSYNARVDAEQERIDNMIEWATPDPTLSPLGQGEAHGHDGLCRGGERQGSDNRTGYRSPGLHGNGDAPD